MGCGVYVGMRRVVIVRRLEVAVMPGIAPES
jgi:hypothetical protein